MTRADAMSEQGRQKDRDSQWVIDRLGYDPDSKPDGKRDARGYPARKALAQGGSDERS